MSMNLRWWVSNNYELNVVCNKVSSYLYFSLLKSKNFLILYFLFAHRDLSLTWQGGFEGDAHAQLSTTCQWVSACPCVVCLPLHMQVLSFSLLLAKSGLSFVEIRWLQLDRKGHNSVASRLSCVLRALSCCLRRASLASRCSAVSWLRACALLPLSISLCRWSLASHSSAVSSALLSL